MAAAAAAARRGRVIVNATSGGTGLSGPAQFQTTDLVACVTDNNSANEAGTQTKTDTNTATGGVTITDLAVTAGSTYYVVVKAGSSAGNGDYDFEITAKDPVDWTPCSEDRYDGKDTFFAFTPAVSGTYTIETDDSSLPTTVPTAIALYNNATSTFMACDDTLSGISSFASVTAALTGGTTYYVRMKQASGTAVLGMRDDAGQTNTARAAIACDMGTGSTDAYAEITRTLAPGTYWVGFRGDAGYTGAYQVRFRDNGVLPAHADQLTCASTTSGGTAQIEASLEAGRDYYLMVKGVGAGDAGTYNLTVRDLNAITDMACSNEDLASGDGYFEFDVNAAAGRNVTIDVDKFDINATHRWDFTGKGKVVEDLIGTTDGYVMNRTLDGDGKQTLSGTTTRSIRRSAEQPDRRGQRHDQRHDRSLGQLDGRRGLPAHLRLRRQRGRRGQPSRRRQQLSRAVGLDHHQQGAPALEEAQPPPSRTSSQPRRSRPPRSAPHRRTSRSCSTIPPTASTCTSTARSSARSRPRTRSRS